MNTFSLTIKEENWEPIVLNLQINDDHRRPGTQNRGYDLIFNQPNHQFARMFARMSIPAINPDVNPDVNPESSLNNSSPTTTRTTTTARMTCTATTSNATAVTTANKSTNTTNTKTTKTTNKNTKTNIIECVICYRGIDEPIALIDCGHVFCKKCFGEVVKHAPKPVQCPKCRKTVSKTLNLFF